MSEKEWQVEMLWRCSTCAEKNLGRYAQCQRCGKPKNGSEAYEMPGDTSSAAAIQDASLVRLASAGANWRCRFCGSDQRRFDNRCANCGADQSQGRDLGATPDAPAAAVPDVSAEVRAFSSGPRFRGWPVVLVALAIFGFIAIRMVTRSSSLSSVSAVSHVPADRDLPAQLDGVSWTQTVRVDRYRTLEGEGFESERPAGAFEIRKTGERVHHTDKVQDGTRSESYTETVPDGTRSESYSAQEACGETCVNRPQNCQNQCTPGKNGFANCKQVCSGGGRSCSPKYCSVTKTRQVPVTKVVTRTREVPKFKDVPRYQDTFAWKYRDWTLDREVKAAGATAETHWPSDEEVALNAHLGDGEKERETRAGVYLLRFRCDGARYEVTSPDVDAFRRSALASAFTLRVENGKARIVDEQAAPAAASASSR